MSFCLVMDFDEGQNLLMHLGNQLFFVVASELNLSPLLINSSYTVGAQ